MIRKFVVLHEFEEIEAKLDNCQEQVQMWQRMAAHLEHVISEKNQLIDDLESENIVLKDGIESAVKSMVEAMKLVHDRGEEISKQREVIEEITTIEGQGYELINGFRNTIKKLEGKLDQSERLVKDISVNYMVRNNDLKVKLEAEEEKNRQLRYKRTH